MAEHYELTIGCAVTKINGKKTKELSQDEAISALVDSTKALTLAVVFNGYVC